MIITIDYDELDPKSYRAVEIYLAGDLVFKAASKRPELDFTVALQWVRQTRYLLLFSSSCDHFVMDTDYEYIYDGDQLIGMRHGQNKTSLSVCLTILEVSALILAIIFFDWQLTVIVFLLMWSSNIDSAIKKRETFLEVINED